MSMPSVTGQMHAGENLKKKKKRGRERLMLVPKQKGQPENIRILN
jgi:rRNA maturation protein Rpf1